MTTNNDAPAPAMSVEKALEKLDEARKSIWKNYRHLAAREVTLINDAYDLVAALSTSTSPEAGHAGGDVVQAMEFVAKTAEDAHAAIRKVIGLCQINVSEWLDESPERQKLRLEVFRALEMPTINSGQAATTARCILAALASPSPSAGEVAITTNGTTRVIPADEPVFLIRGQDAVGYLAVRAWAIYAETAGAGEAIVASARQHAGKMEAWPKKKVADLPKQEGGR